MIFQKRTINELKSFNYFNSVPIIEKRKAVRIVAIDDEDFIPLINLLSDGYQIGFIKDHDDIRSLRGYNIVICDVEGVGVSRNNDEHGAALIGEIKRVYPEKQVIVYSGLMGNVKKLKLARERADYFIPKSAQPSIWNETLDEAIENCLCPVKLWEHCKGKLSEIEVTSREIATLEDKFVKSVLNRKADPLRELVKKKRYPDSAKGVVNGLLSSAIWSLTGGVFLG